MPVPLAGIVLGDTPAGQLLAGVLSAAGQVPSVAEFDGRERVVRVTLPDGSPFTVTLGPTELSSSDPAAPLQSWVAGHVHLDGGLTPAAVAVADRLARDGIPLVAEDLGSALAAGPVRYLQAVAVFSSGEFLGIRVTEFDVHPATDPSPERIGDPAPPPPPAPDRRPAVGVGCRIARRARHRLELPAGHCQHRPPPGGYRWTGPVRPRRRTARI